LFRQFSIFSKLSRTRIEVANSIVLKLKKMTDTN